MASQPSPPHLLFLLFSSSSLLSNDNGWSLELGLGIHCGLYFKLQLPCSSSQHCNPPQLLYFSLNSFFSCSIYFHMVYSICYLFYPHVKCGFSYTENLDKYLLSKHMCVGSGTQPCQGGSEYKGTHLRVFSVALECQGKLHDSYRS